MKNYFKYGDKVILRSFHNTLHVPEDVDDTENYWKLIGSVGKIISNKKKSHPAFLNMGERVLVKFENIEKFGLICHNEIPNSLWIFLSDLAYPQETGLDLD